MRTLTFLTLIAIYTFSRRRVDAVRSTMRNWTDRITSKMRLYWTLERQDAHKSAKSRCFYVFVACCALSAHSCCAPGDHHHNSHYHPSSVIARQLRRHKPVDSETRCFSSSLCKHNNLVGSKTHPNPNTHALYMHKTRSVAYRVLHIKHIYNRVCLICWRSFLVAWSPVVCQHANSRFRIKIATIIMTSWRRGFYNLIKYIDRLLLNNEQFQLQQHCMKYRIRNK